jgi:hypothetical protein
MKKHSVKKVPKKNHAIKEVDAPIDAGVHAAVGDHVVFDIPKGNTITFEDKSPFHKKIFTSEDACAGPVLPGSLGEYHYKVSGPPLPEGAGPGMIIVP